MPKFFNAIPRVIATIQRHEDSFLRYGCTRGDAGFGPMNRSACKWYLKHEVFRTKQS